MLERLCSPGMGQGTGNGERRTGMKSTFGRLQQAYFWQASGATPKSFARRSSSLFSCAMLSCVPKNSRWAVPTETTSPTSGSAMSQSAAISPGWFVPISRTRNSASSGQFKIVIGSPMGWLKFPAVPEQSRKVLRNSLVVVLPADPVTPMTLALSVRRRSRAFACRAASPSTISAAPAASATPMKSCPSTFSPLSATKPIPGFTSRLSNVYFIPSPNRESRTASHESRHAALGVAVERDELLDLVDLLDVVLDAVEGLRAVETLAVDEAVGFLERLDGVLGEAAARQSDDVDADDFDAAVDHVDRKSTRLNSS